MSGALSRSWILSLALASAAAYLPSGIAEENKPEACKKFFCKSKDPGFAEMIKKIEEHKS